MSRKRVKVGRRGNHKDRGTTNGHNRRGVSRDQVRLSRRARERQKKGRRS